ncbi:uncharacterized protein RHOBADRAFT_53432 [Rhodotorula graminis WP1]|uniref:Uncharacterized protein n=1 Tax=Rhodotorula graminis (strain WP1) TaxID=578459 RepID=A0A194S4E9_RHOGW|nr:uncharacterized protein RHOBADRAFT_53432 [Rhodotorula graminis WP1]KPV75457.1 hypothetical protein RHOBADRAFT_53432 [Rhodotorula graminis WP1]
MATTDATLVLQDLLSLPAPDFVPPATLAQLVALHLGSLPLSTPHLALVPLLVRYTLQSPALWSSLDPQHAWDRHRLAFDAARQGVLLRLDTLARPPSTTPALPSSSSSTVKGNTGWSARRAVHTFLRELYAGLWADPTSTTTGDGRVDPLVRLTLASGVLAALQEWKRRKEKLWVGGASALDRAEKEAGRAWTEWSDARRQQAGRELEAFPAWLAAQTVPFVRVEQLAADWNAPVLLSGLSTAFSSAFAHGTAFSHPPLAADLSSTASGLEWAVPSPSHTHLSALVQRPLFTSLGPLSRALGRALEATALTAAQARSDPLVVQASLSAIHSLSESLLAVATALSAAWAATPWSDHSDEQALAPATRAQTAPWTLLKSLLFAQTLVYSSLLEVVSAAPGSEPGTPPTALQRTLASEAVQALARTYFVALRFGQAGFEAWRAVLAGLVEVVAAPTVGARAEASSGVMEGDEEGDSAPSPAEELVRSLEPQRVGPHERAVERAGATFWLNTAEQVMRSLGDDYVERVVLRGCRPYLDDATYRDSFEAAHSVVLAVFSTTKRCACDVAPWYIDLLLRTYPSLLSPTQLRLAYATVVAGVTAAGDDALAWWCVEELLARIDALPPSNSSATSIAAEQASTPRRTVALRDLAEDDGPTARPVAEVATAAATAADAPSIDDDAMITPAEQRVLALPRGAHLLVLVALLPSVSLSLLPTVLSALEALVRHEPVGSDARDALVHECFAVLGSGMDAVKRGEGVKWWLERGRGLLVGGPLEEEKDGALDEVRQATAEKEEQETGPGDEEAKL